MDTDKAIRRAATDHAAEKAHEEMANKARAQKTQLDQMRAQAQQDRENAKREYIRAEANRLKAAADRKAELAVLARTSHDKVAQKEIVEANQADEKLPGK